MTADPLPQLVASPSGEAGPRIIGWEVGHDCYEIWDGRWVRDWKIHVEIPQLGVETAIVTVSCAECLNGQHPRGIW